MSENLLVDLYLDEDDLLAMPALEGHEKINLQPEETIDERVRLKLRERKKHRSRIKNLYSK